MRLFEVSDAGSATEQGNLAKLVSDSGARRRKPVVAERHPQDGMRTFFDAIEQWRILTQQLTQRHPMNSRHLRRVRNQLDIAPRPRPQMA